MMARHVPLTNVLCILAAPLHLGRVVWTGEILLTASELRVGSADGVVKLHNSWLE